MTNYSTQTPAEPGDLIFFPYSYGSVSGTVYVPTLFKALLEGARNVKPSDMVDGYDNHIRSDAERVADMVVWRLASAESAWLDNAVG